MLDKWLAAGRLAIKDMDLDPIEKAECGGGAVLHPLRGHLHPPDGPLLRCPHPDEGGLIFHTLRRAGVKPALFFVPRPDSRPFPPCRE